ncbi:MAG: alpha/beta hydrolase [Novosphingobium sp.]|nr:alpha/beta hydrolase [Novosphingobium sp.]
MKQYAQAAARVALLRAEVARRGALALQPRPEGVRGPKWQAFLGELRTPVEHWQANRQAARAPCIGDQARVPSRPVMLLPGFGTHPARMKPLGRALEDAGHRVSDWGLGFNFGPSEDRFERLCERVVTMARKEGQPLVLVGWSLGGIFAREVAKVHPEAVRLVVTMGTPFSGDRRANNAWRAYQLIAGHSVDEPPIGQDMSAKPPVPTVALWSARDGIVSPRSSCGRRGERDLAIPMRCTHLGFAAHPDVAAMLKRLVAAY